MAPCTGWCRPSCRQLPRKSAGWRGHPVARIVEEHPPSTPAKAMGQAKLPCLGCQLRPPNAPRTR
eukprot:4057271-Lingulodinium_polyedra.AAC.1